MVPTASPGPEHAPNPGPLIAVGVDQPADFLAILGIKQRHRLLAADRQQFAIGAEANAPIARSAP